MGSRLTAAFMILALATLGWTSSAAQSPQPTPPTGEQAPVQQLAGTISGIVVDQSGAVVAGARVSLTAASDTGKEQVLIREVTTGGDGQYSFAEIVPGPFQIAVIAAGFEPQTFSGVVLPAEAQIVPQIALAVATRMSEVDVTLTRNELAEKQVQVEEKQRVLGAIPNFYVSYVPDAVPITTKIKFKLAWKTVIDPITLAMVGGAAGIEQAQNHFTQYGQGAQGYGKRFGASYADTFSGTFLSAAILPSLLKQDPRYFYKGTGNKASRFFYAIANSMICKGDNGRWQVNYSNILGNLAAGGLSNVYYPAQDRNGLGLTFENASIGIGATALSNVLQEFLIRKLTPKIPSNSQPKP